MQGLVQNDEITARTAKSTVANIWERNETELDTKRLCYVQPSYMNVRPGQYSYIMHRGLT